MRLNTAYALRHEPPPPADLFPPGAHVLTVWVLNRLLNATEEALLVAELHSSEIDDDDVVVMRLALSPNCVRCLPRGRRLPYVMGLNHARNAMVCGCCTALSISTGLLALRHTLNDVSFGIIILACLLFPSISLTRSSQGLRLFCQLDDAMRRGAAWALPLDGNQVCTLLQCY